VKAIAPWPAHPYDDRNFQPSTTDHSVFFPKKKRKKEEEEGEEDDP